MIVPIGLAAQSCAVYLGPQLGDHKGNEIQNIFGNDSASFYTLRYTGRKRDGLIMEQISTDSLHSIGHTKVEFPITDGREPLLLYPITLGRHCYLLTTAELPADDEVLLHAWKIETGLVLSRQPVLLGKISRKVITSGQVFLTYSNKEKNLLALIIPTEHEPLRNTKFEMALLDVNLLEIFRRQLELPHPSGKITFNDVLIDSSEAIYILISSQGRPLPDKEEKRNLGRQYALVRYHWVDQSVQEKALSIGTKWIYEAGLVKNKEGNIQVVGYYSNMVDLVMSGTLSVELDPGTGNILNQGLMPFDRGFKARFRPLGAGPDKTDLGLFTLGHLFSDLPGQTDLLSEKRFSQTSTVFNPATGTYSIIKIFNFDHILLTRIDPTGKVLFTYKIPKFQSSSRSEGIYTSYLALRQKGTTYFIYNDHEKNAPLDLSAENSYRSVNSPAVSAPVIVELQSDGTVNKKLVYGSSESKFVFNPRFHYEIPGAVILATFSGSRVQYVRVSIR